MFVKGKDTVHINSGRLFSPKKKESCHVGQLDEPGHIVSSEVIHEEKEIHVFAYMLIFLKS